jgi:hypothetical protein
MLSARTLKTLAILLTGYVLLAMPAYLGPALLEEMSSYLVILPLLSIYLFTRLAFRACCSMAALAAWECALPRHGDGFFSRYSGWVWRGCWRGDLHA